MKEIFFERAKENLEAAEFLFEKGLFNASANRAYFAVFHLAIAAIFFAGIIPNIDHKIIQTLFAEHFCNKRKIVASKFKSFLFDMHKVRSYADYKCGVSKKDAKQQLKDAKEFFEIIMEVIK